MCEILKNSHVNVRSFYFYLSESLAKMWAQNDAFLTQFPVIDLVLAEFTMKTASLCFVMTKALGGLCYLRPYCLPIVALQEPLILCTLMQSSKSLVGTMQFYLKS